MMMSEQRPDVQFEHVLRNLTPRTINLIIEELTLAMDEASQFGDELPPAHHNSVKSTRDYARDYMRRAWEPYGREVK
jgi:hypothetical protein